MSYVAPATKKAGYEEAPEQKIHRIRITLTSRNVQNLEKGTYLPYLTYLQSDSKQCL